MSRSTLVELVESSADDSKNITQLGVETHPDHFDHHSGELVAEMSSQHTGESTLLGQLNISDDKRSPVLDSSSSLRPRSSRNQRARPPTISLREKRHSPRSTSLSPPPKRHTSYL